MAVPEIKKEIEEMVDEMTEVEYNQSMKVQEVDSADEDEMDDKKELDLENIDMMQIPIQFHDGIDLLEHVKCEDETVMTIPNKEVSIDEEDIAINGGCELMQETHVCFFSLLRDAFISKGEYRMSTTEMKDAVTLWQGNPISPLNDWYSLATSWPALVPRALGFLAGELAYIQEHDQLQQEREQEFVPYLENKGRGVYAWIGAGRDSDSRLSLLCSRFLLNR